MERRRNPGESLPNTRPGGLALHPASRGFGRVKKQRLATKASLVTTIYPGRSVHDVDQPGNTSRANLLIPWPARPWRWRPPLGWMWTTRDLPPSQGNLGRGRDAKTRRGSNAGRMPVVDEGAWFDVGAVTCRVGRARLTPRAGDGAVVVTPPVHGSPAGDATPNFGSVHANIPAQRRALMG